MAAATPFRKWALAWLGGSVARWLGGPVIGIANGALRQALYANRLGEQRANQLSTLSLVAALDRYVRAVDWRWPIASARDAALIGAGWAGLGAAFEFGFGHYVVGDPWPELLRAYDVSKGQIWGLVLVSIAVAPTLARRARLRRRTVGPDAARHLALEWLK